MNRTLSRVLWIIAGVLLIIAGVLCLASPGVAVESLALWFGLAMLFSGIVDVAVFAAGQSCMAGSGWFDQWFTALTLPFLFGMWLMFSGITKFANSFELKRLGIRGWGWFTVLGLVLAAAGFLSFLEPVAGLLALSILVGVFFLLQGIASILRGCFSSRFWL